jgi:hypothetical protein
MTLLISPGSLIQSSFRTEGVPNFEAVLYIPERSQLQHYYRENHRPDKFWMKGQVINAPEFPVMGGRGDLSEQFRFKR